MEIQLWREILSPYQLGVDELMVKFNHIISEYRSVGLYSPIEQVHGRVKKISSILEKAQKKNIEIADINGTIEDIAGIRIICQFVEDIYAVVDIIKNRTDMEIKYEKDYVAHIKPSGYRSYHIVVYYNVETMKGSLRIPVEIQIRTLAMNFWATIEHSLQYKYKYNMPEQIRDRLNAASVAIINLDNEMSCVHEEIMDAQKSFQYKANIVREILNNIQNLYKVAKSKEVIKMQDEFYKIYKKDDLELLEKFARELDVLAESYRAQGL